MPHPTRHATGMSLVVRARWRAWCAGWRKHADQSHTCRNAGCNLVCRSSSLPLCWPLTYLVLPTTHTYTHTTAISARRSCATPAGACSHTHVSASSVKTPRQGRTRSRASSASETFGSKVCGAMCTRRLVLAAKCHSGWRTHECPQEAASTAAQPAPSGCAATTSSHTRPCANASTATHTHVRARVAQHCPGRCGADFMVHTVAGWVWRW